MTSTRHFYIISWLGLVDMFQESNLRFDNFTTYLTEPIILFNSVTNSLTSRK